MSVDRGHVVQIAAQSSDELIREVLLALFADTMPESFGANAYVMRASAIATDDELAAGVLLSLLGETQSQALAALEASCWQEDLSANPAEQRELLRQSIASAIAPRPSAGTL